MVSARLPAHRVALGLAALAEDALVVDLAQLPLELVEQRLGGRQQRLRGRLRAHVFPLSGHVTVRGEAGATVLEEGDLEAFHLVELRAQILAALLDRLAAALVVLDVLEGHHHHRILRHKVLRRGSAIEYCECAGRVPGGRAEGADRSAGYASRRGCGRSLRHGWRRAASFEARISPTARPTATVERAGIVGR